MERFFGFLYPVGIAVMWLVVAIRPWAMILIYAELLFRSFAHPHRIKRKQSFALFKNSTLLFKALPFFSGKQDATHRAQLWNASLFFRICVHML